MAEHDWPAIIQPVAEAFWGEPNKKLSTPKELRWGSQGSHTVNLEKACWFDHEAGEGGNVIELVQREQGIGDDKAAAMAWLEREGFIAATEKVQDRRNASPAPETRPELEQPPANSSDDDGGVLKWVKGYTYTDADGNALYQVLRGQWELPDGSWRLAKDGQIAKTFRQRRKDERGNIVWNLDGIGHTIYRHQQLELALEAGKTIHLCYSPDTEVLTPNGWVAFPDLGAGIPVAQYNLDSADVSFVVPKARQRFHYSGDMVHIKSRWCDLMVTEDHRQPRKIMNRKLGRFCPTKVVPASEIVYHNYLPTAGYLRGGEAIPENVARLTVAWLADGVWEPRGDQISWNLKKQRKRDRLRSLLSSLDIPWTEHEYPSTVGWLSFRVRKEDIAKHIAVCPDKRWRWEMLNWSLDARQAALDELGYWDGDSTTELSSRLFTGERQSADVASALAAISGMSSGLRVDHRPEQGKNDSYVVNLKSVDWRMLSKTPERVPYDGFVYCCTVDTGLLIVRRNGKVMISGNCEGEKDVETIEGMGLVGSTNSGGAKNWSPEMAANFKDADVLILVDNDEVGIEAGEAKAKSLKGIARRIRILNFADHVPNFPAKHDLSNWVEAGGTADELQRIIDSLPDWKPKPPASKLGAVTLSNVGKEAKKHQWLVQDMIELGGSAAFAGFSQSGKSFLMIELAFAVATGRKFWGRDVMQGLVAYQTGEGDRGFMKRVQGYMQDKGIEDPASVPMLILPKKINLFVDDKDTDTLIAEAKAWAEHYEQPLRMIVIDTFNKATRGANEISGLDMGKVIDRIERIAEECQCTVMVVDHLSAQGRFRGHGSKTGDLTNVLTVEMGDKTDRNGRKIRRIKLDKNKDGENGGSIPFVLRQVVVGFDDLNRPITTCVVDQPDGDDDEQTKTGRLSLNQALVLQTLRDVIGREGEPPPVGVTGCPKGRNVVSWKAFMAEVGKKWTYQAPEGEPEKRAGELRRIVADAGKKLQLAGFIDRDNERGLREGEKGLIWWTGKEDRVFVKPAPEPAPELPTDVKRELAEASDEPPF